MFNWLFKSRKPSYEEIALESDIFQEMSKTIDKYITDLKDRENFVYNIVDLLRIKTEYENCKFTYDKWWEKLNDIKKSRQ